MSFGIFQCSVLGPILVVLYKNSLAKTGSSLQMNIYVEIIALIFKNKSMKNLEIDGLLHFTTLYLNLNIKDLYDKQIKTACIIIKITDSLILSLLSL